MTERSIFGGEVGARAVEKLKRWQAIERFRFINVRARIREQEVVTTHIGPKYSRPGWRGADGYVHIRPVRTTGNRPPLICFFPGDPDAQPDAVLGARALAEALPKDQPVYVFGEPNMDGTSVFPTIEELADAFLQDVRKIQQRGPYQLCGYSAVGLVAYEMARLLHAQGDNVSLLALFDIWNPRFRQMLTRQELMRYQLARMAVRFRKYGRFLSEQRYSDFSASLHEFVMKGVRKAGWWMMKPVYRNASRALPKTMQTIESVASHLTYTPMVYPGRMVLIRPNDPFAEIIDDRTVGWRHCVTGGVDVHFVRGDHGNMVRPPYVRELVEKIVPYLASAPIQSRQAR